MLALTTSVTIPNISRMKVTAFTAPDIDVSDFMPVSVAVLGPPQGQTDQVQLARAYGAIQVLKIRNGTCDTLSFSNDATANPFAGLVVRGQGTFASLLDTCMAAIIAAGNNPRNQLKAIETALSTAGVLPAGTVA